MENKIPTAEDFFIDNKLIPFHTDSFHMKEIHKIMIEFAKLHVEAALKEASENAELKYRINDISCNDKILNKNSILNAYPLTNIK
jgi:hypothetical protein